MAGVVFEYSKNQSAMQLRKFQIMTEIVHKKNILVVTTIVAPQDFAAIIGLMKAEKNQ